MDVIRLFDKETDAALGEINHDQLQFLIDRLEEEHLEDQDYYLNRPTLELFEDQGGQDELVQLLRDALGDRDEMEIRWESG